MASTVAGRGSGRFLPPDPRTTEPYRLTPKLALRIAVLGTLALAVFGILFLRLWALQILSGTQYLQTAQSNQLRKIPLPAPRGAIVDAHGRVLVKNKPGTAIELWPADLKKNRYVELRRLAKVVDVPLAQMAAQLRKQRLFDPLSPVTVKEPATEAEVRYLSERTTQFPGVRVAESYLRQYPHGSLAAQVLGYVGEISPEELKRDRQRGYKLGDIVGQSGVEAKFDGYLRGRPGFATMRVDANGNPRSRLTPRAQPIPGQTVRLTIDLDLQAAAERALTDGIKLAQSQNFWAARGGAIVAIDPRDGSIRALASNPTYNPNVYVGDVTTKKLAAAGLTNATAAEKNYPALDRAIYSAYPPGSTFKPVVALAALQERLISPYTQLQCTGSLLVDGHTFNNWDPYVNQPMALQEALARSCDTYFYQVGLRFYHNDPSRGPALQRWAASYGIGRTTGLDIGGEAAGLLPTPAWRKQHFTKDWDPNWQVDRIWKSGDSVQLAIGQKDIAVTPLQMARFYALIANGGRPVTPHVLAQVEPPGGNGTQPRALRNFTPAAVPRANIDAASLEAIRQGLYDATHASYGTSTATFGSFPVQIAGKTGTAEKVIHVPGDPTGYNMAQSWWCGYGPYSSPELVVCALIENGGHGGTAAAPAALKVFEAYFHQTALQAGTAATD